MLKLKKLYLSGWMSYDTQEIILDEPGVTYIKGKVGSGKSAILEAICQLVFGEMIRKRSSVKDLENKILKNGYDNSIDIEVDNVEATIREIRGREVPGMEPGLHFIIPSKKESDQRGKTDPETRKKIAKFIRIPYNEFRSKSMLGQMQSQDLVEGTPGARGKAIVEIFSLDRYDTIIKECEGDVKETDNTKETKRNNFELIKGELDNLEKSLLEDVDSLQEIDEDEIKELDKKITAANERLDDLHEEAKRASSVIGKATLLAQQKEKYKKIEKNIEKFKLELKHLPIPSEDKNRILKRIEEATSKKFSIEAKAKIEQKNLDTAKTIENECPITKDDCPVNVPTEHKEKIIKACEKTLESGRETWKKIASETKELTGEKSKIETYEEAKDKVEREERILENLSVNEGAPDVGDQKERLKKCEDTIEKGKTHVEGLREKKNDLIAAKSKVEERERTKERIKETLTSKRKLLGGLETELGDLSIQLQYLSAASSVFKRARMVKIDLVLDLLNTSVKDILDNISEKKLKAQFISSKMDSKGKKMLDKIDILVADFYKELPISMWSGGQRTQVGLAILLSVFKTASTISNKRVNCLWLDEPFGPLDEVLVDLVFESIISVAKDINASSVKIISHRDLDQRLWDHFWEVGMTNGISNLDASGVVPSFEIST